MRSQLSMLSCLESLCCHSATSFEEFDRFKSAWRFQLQFISFSTSFKKFYRRSSVLKVFQDVKSAKKQPKSSHGKSLDQPQCSHREAKEQHKISQVLYMMSEIAQEKSLLLFQGCESIYLSMFIRHVQKSKNLVYSKSYLPNVPKLGGEVKGGRK